MSEIATRGKFTLPWLPGEFEGYAFTGPADSFNGDSIPYFELEVMWKIITALYDTAKAELVHTEDGDKVLHPLGGQAWEWLKAKKI